MLFDFLFFKLLLVYFKDSLAIATMNFWYKVNLIPMFYVVHTNCMCSRNEVFLGSHDEHSAAYTWQKKTREEHTASHYFLPVPGLQDAPKIQSNSWKKSLFEDI